VVSLNRWINRGRGGGQLKGGKPSHGMNRAESEDDNTQIDKQLRIVCKRDFILLQTRSLSFWIAERFFLSFSWMKQLSGVVKGLNYWVCLTLGRFHLFNDSIWNWLVKDKVFARTVELNQKFWFQGPVRCLLNYPSTLYWDVTARNHNWEW